MPKVVSTFFLDPPTRPFCGCCGAVNFYFAEALRELGHEVQGIHGEGRRWSPRPVRAAVPLDAAAMAMRIQALPTADIAIHCDSGLRLGGLRRGSARKHVVFFHGFGGFNEWARNEFVSRFLGYSRYVRDVVQSLLGMPDLRRRRLLDARGFGVVSFIRVALPCIEFPNGAYEQGAPELPSHLKEAIARDDILGHCVMSSKVDTRAAYSIILLLNRLAQEQGLGRRFRLVVGEEMFNAAQLLMQLPPEQFPATYLPLREALKSLGLSVSDILIPAPLLTQGALFELLRGCRFGLFYNVFPEPFGFYPLESVFHDCPVYTNGAGNLRYLLPEGHGIHTHESEEMVTTGNVLAYLPVARAIYEDTVEAPEVAVERCRRGVRHMLENYNRETMRHDISLELELLEPEPEPVEFDSLRARLGPLVRQWNPTTRIAVTDQAWRELSLQEVELAQAALGQSGAEISRLGDSEQLFREGILSFSLPA